MGLRSMTRQRRLPGATDDICVKLSIYNEKKLACGLGDPSDGLHERINWNAV